MSLKISVSLSADESKVIGNAIDARRKVMSLRMEEVEFEGETLQVHPFDYLDLCEFMKSESGNELILQRIRRKAADAIKALLPTLKSDTSISDANKYLTMLIQPIPFGCRLTSPGFHARKRFLP